VGSSTLILVLGYVHTRPIREIIKANPTTKAEKLIELLNPEIRGMGKLFSILLCEKGAQWIKREFSTEPHFNPYSSRVPLPKDAQKTP
jgi:hypothetical protein